MSAEWWPVPAALQHRFRVLEPFAHGGSGSLYIADEPETGRRGLLKILAPHQTDAAERQRLRRELVKQATLARSHLVVPLASGDSDGVTWIFREWLDGVSLDVRLSREGALQQTEALAIAAQVASALDELHRGGLLHRDVKPGHIFLQPSPHGIPRALLLDAGVVALLDRGPAGDVHGTAGFVAPEQLLGKLVSFRSDLYSLGCVLYRMLTGRPAFAGDSVASTLSAQRYGELPPLPSDLPPGIGALLRSILAKDPQQRPFSAQKLRRTLDPFLPDGALMEKQQSTSTYEAVALENEPPRASGTLRPPPPPRGSTAPQGPRPPTPNAAPPAPPRRSDAPSARAPVEAPAPRPREEGTQQIDIAQLMEVAPLPKRSTSTPPPTPEKLSEKTQPIRLDMILGVAAAQKQASAPSVRQSSEPPPVPPGVGKATVPSMAPPPPPAAFGKATTHGMAPPPPHGELLTPPRVAEEARAGEPGDATPRGFGMQTVQGLGAIGASEPQGPLFQQPSEPEPPVPTQPEQAGLFQAAPAEEPVAPRPPAKMTMMGMGAPANSLEITGAHGGDATLERPSALPTGPLANTSERDHPTERLPMAVDRDAAFGEEADGGSSLTAPLSVPLTLSTNALQDLRARLMTDKRAQLYVGAGVAGALLLIVGLGALFSSEPELSANNAGQAAQPAAAVAPQQATPPTPSEPAVAKAPAPVPTVEPLAASPSAPPAAVADEPAGKPKVESLPPPKVEAAPREPVREVVASKPKRESTREPKEQRSKSAKVGKPAAPDKSAQFAAARDQARDAYSAKDYKAAAAAYEKASKLDPKHAGTFAGLGASRLQLGDNKAAVQAYQRAVSLSPGTSGFHAALGRAYLATGDRGKAVASYKKALQLDPKNEAAKAALAQLGG